LFILMAAVPVLTYILIAASFSPSVYGQSFPEARARFAARLLMTMALMLEGICIGLLVAQWKMRWSSLVSMFGLAMLMIAALYPLHTSWNLLHEKLPLYQRWAAIWDIRQNILLADKASGIQDVTTFKIYSIEGVKELDPNADHWVNRCAAHYYGFRSISAP
jgi:hypothetical protein